MAMLLALAITPPWLSLGVAAASVLVLWFGKERIFRGLIQSPALRPEYDFRRGMWNVVIEFDDEDGKGSQTRTGTLEVCHQVYGIDIRGNTLMNPGTNQTTMNGWYAENIDIISYDQHQLLAYLYKVPVADALGTDGTDERFEKVGFVYAIRKNDTPVFAGEFRDITVCSDISRSRVGKIRIFPVH
jgi:hypothetical protein